MKKILIVSALAIMIMSCGEPPKADFTWEPEIPRVGQEVKFTNLSENAASYSWNFGDMSVGSEENPVHVYEIVGDHIVDLHAHSGLKTDVKTVTTTVVE